MQIFLVNQYFFRIRLAQRKLVAAHRNFDRIAQRRHLANIYLSPARQAHIHDAAAGRALALDLTHGNSCAARRSSQIAHCFSPFRHRYETPSAAKSQRGADAEEEPADEVAPAGEEKSAEEGTSAQPPAAEDEEKKRAEHEAAEAQRKAEFDAKQQAKKAAEQEQIARLEAMSDEEVIAASTQRVSTDVEKLTRRNMKECVSEHIQMLCMEDTAFARLTMHPKKNMIRCFQYINRKAWDYVQDELKASGTRPGPGQQTYGCDVPDDMCYQWAEDYFRDPDAKEDHEDEEKFVPKPYAGKSSAKSKPKKAAEKKKTEPKAAPKQEEKKPSQDGQMSLLDFGMAKAG